MADYARAVMKALRAAKCYPLRPGNGDHYIWHSPRTGINFPVDSCIKSRHTANGIMKQAGLPKQF